MIRLGIVASEFNQEITGEMVKHALKRAKKIGAAVNELVHVPGVFDSPLAVKKLLKRKNVDGVVVIGAVLKGETEHDELIAEAAARAFTGLSLAFEKPVALGVIGPGATWRQAKAREKEYAERAVDAAVKMVEAMGR